MTILASTGSCQCGCGQPISGPHRRFVVGHDSRRIDPLVSYDADPATGCWVWNRSRSTGGYGTFKRAGNRIVAHRWFYEQHVGPIPDGLVLDHLCCNPPCVNPAHLEPVTDEVNVKRSPAYASNRKVCAQGHPFDEDNTYVPPDGSRRVCRACNRAAAARYTARKKAIG